MPTAVGEMTEPRVLAQTKRRLFPDDGATDTYAVVDTQFASGRWLAGSPIESSTKEVLSPFNHVRVGSGYPDLVGVRALNQEFVSTDQRGEQPPLVIVEAKGYTEQGSVDVDRGIVQAHDRLQEANVAFVAAPSSAVSRSTRTLARELNVGVLGVRSNGVVESLEAPRIVGNQATTETTAIRFQASAQGVADKSFGLNHPKNYLAYPLAVYHTEPTEQLLEERVVRAVPAARQGAVFLGLVADQPDGIGLTPLGQEVIRFALREYDSVDRALDKFDNWKRSRQRFCDLAPRWGLLTRRVVFAYPATRLLVNAIQSLHDDGVDEPTLRQLVESIHMERPSFTVELFIRGDEEVRQRVLTTDGELRTSELREGPVFHSPTVFQLKAMLYHAGILTERGAEPSNLDPLADIWALREQI